MPTRSDAAQTRPKPEGPVEPPLRAYRTVAGRYALGEQLGRGSSAVVYRAQDLRLARTVAVKLFQRQLDAADQQRAEQEVATLVRLDHPGLVRLLDGGVSGLERFVVLELVEGQSLSRRLEDGPLPVKGAAGLIADVARTLAYVHGCGIVHRDVKPANLLIDAQGRPRLSDFGVARWAGEREALTETGCIVGTPRYMAPEQVRGEPVTGAVDVYALGLVLLECLTGAPEYAGGGLECAVARLYRGPAVPDWLPPELADVVRAMTDGDPLRRPTAGQVTRMLRRGAVRASVPELLLEPAPYVVPVAVQVPQQVRREWGRATDAGPRVQPRVLLVAAGLLLAATAMPLTGLLDRGGRTGAATAQLSPSAPAVRPGAGGRAVTPPSGSVGTLSTGTAGSAPSVIAAGPATPVRAREASPRNSVHGDGGHGRSKAQGGEGGDGRASD